MHKKLLHIQLEFRSFSKWLEANHPKTKMEWIKLFKKNFKFTGGEIVSEFLRSIGYLRVHMLTLAQHTEKF